MRYAKQAEGTDSDQCYVLRSNSELSETLVDLFQAILEFNDLSLL